MRIIRRQLQKLGVAVIAVLLLLPEGNAKERLEPTDYAEVAGIHSWLVEIPSDLIDGEYLATCWTYPSVDGKPSQVDATGMSFEDVLPGTTAKLFIWFQPWLNHKGKDMEGMKFCVKFKDKEGEPQKRYGTLKIPDGYVDLHAYAESGDRTDSAWIMMMTNPNNEPERSSVFLDFHYITPAPEQDNRTNDNSEGADDQLPARTESEAK